MHPYHSKTALHMERVSRMLDGAEREKGPKAKHEQEREVYARGGQTANEHGDVHGGKAKSRLDKYKKGGKVKGKTNIHINVMPQGGAGGPPPGGPPTLPPGLAAAAMAPKPPMGPPPGAMPGGPPPGAGGPPPGMMPHKAGGRTGYKDGGSVNGGPLEKRKAGGKINGIRKAGAPAWAEGLKKGTKVQHAVQGDGITQDKGDTNRKNAITRKAGGKVSDFSQNLNKIPSREASKDFGNSGAKGKSRGDFSEKLTTPTPAHAAGGGKGRMEKRDMKGKGGF